LFKEIEAKKETLAVKGKSPQERAEDFAKLNYLLQYLKDDYDPETSASSPNLLINQPIAGRTQSNQEYPSRPSLIQIMKNASALPG
jgi:hypothetical protein